MVIWVMVFARQCFEIRSELWQWHENAHFPRLRMLNVVFTGELRSSNLLPLMGGIDWYLCSYEKVDPKMSYNYASSMVYALWVAVSLQFMGRFVWFTFCGGLKTCGIGLCMSHASKPRKTLQKWRKSEVLGDRSPSWDPLAKEKEFFLGQKFLCFLMHLFDNFGC